MEINKIIILISIVMLILFSIGLVSASDSGDELALSNDTDVINYHIDDLDENEVISSPDVGNDELNSASNPDSFIVNKRNYQKKFIETEKTAEG